MNHPQMVGRATYLRQAESRLSPTDRQWL